MSDRRKRVISTDQIQFNHKPLKMLLPQQRESAKMAKPQIYLGSAHSMHQISQYLSDIKYCSIQSWPHGGLSSLPMVPTTRNLTAPPTPLQIYEQDDMIWYALITKLQSEHHNEMDLPILTEAQVNMVVADDSMLNKFQLMRIVIFIK